MRRDLLHWEDALQLARNLAPQEIPFICREYATEMECTGDYVNALMHYERAVNPPSDINGEDISLWNMKQKSCALRGYNEDDAEENAEWTKHISLCNAGIARNAIRLGDLKRGIELSSKSGNPNLQKECADILEQYKVS
ncbi:unnamed protein product [Trichobilharzia regenti]|nr:unnamed protein product [Trichobilharzia regenti]